MIATSTPLAPALVREIDRQTENSRDWDHEGDLESLTTECALDRKETGCAGHDYFEYDSGHYLVWRDWSNADLPTPSPSIKEGEPPQ